MGSLCGSLLGMVFKEENITGLVHIPQGWAINYHHSNWESSFMNLFHGGSHTISSEIERHHQQSLSPCIESSTNHVWIQTQGQNFSFFYFFLFLIFNFLGFGPFDKTAIACLHVCHEPIGLGWSFSWGKAMGWTTEVSHGRRVWAGACPLFCNFLFAFYPFHFFFQKFGPRPSYKSSHHNQSVDFLLIWHSLSLLQATELEIFI